LSGGDGRREGRSKEKRKIKKEWRKTIIETSREKRKGGEESDASA
jgi:hypothetical protein